MDVLNLDSAVKVYNFEVEDWHIYYVSDKGILVHNMCAEGTSEAIALKVKNVISGIPNSLKVYGKCDEFA